MKKTFTIIVCICAITAQAQEASNEAIRKLQMAGFAITNLYVDSVDENKLVEEAIIKMLTQLDPHSVYNDAEEAKKMNEPLQGNFEGIGVQFQMIEDTLFMVQPVSDGPSEKVGILIGDRIIAVNDSAIARVKMSTEEIMSRLHGAKGSEVKLTIVRHGVNEPLYFTVKQDKIPILGLDASYIIQPRTGCIRISRFGATTPEEFLKALKQLQKKGMKDLILSLQGGDGGYLNTATDLANEFLQQKDLIVYTEGKVTRRNNFYTRGNGDFKDRHLIVLVGRYSASASEIVTGAIQDWDRGVIVGHRTFGEGSVQRPIDLSNGSMIRLTIARYYTPPGRCIQEPYNKTANLDGKFNGKGILEKYNQELIDRFSHDELMHTGGTYFPSSLRCQTKKLARTVYGGGGIIPNFFVPIDTAQYSDYHRGLVAKGVVIKTTMKFIEDHRKELQNRCKKFGMFDNKFEISDEVLASIRTLAGKKKIKFDEKQYRQSLPLIKTQLKALIARDLWDMSECFQIINTTNNSIIQTLKVLNEGVYEKIVK